LNLAKHSSWMGFYLRKDTYTISFNRRRTNLPVGRQVPIFARDLLADSQLDFEAPERGVRLHQLKADVPCFVIAPDYFRFSLAARFRMD